LEIRNDTSNLHAGIRDWDALVTSPARGNSFEGFMIEQIVTLENLHQPGSGFYFFRTHVGAEIDLLMDRGQSRIGFEFKAAASIDPRDWQHLETGLKEGVIDRALLVYSGRRTFDVSAKIRVVPAAELLTGAAKW
jgi:hypothetical protein